MLLEASQQRTAHLILGSFSDSGLNPSPYYSLWHIVQKQSTLITFNLLFYLDIFEDFCTYSCIERRPPASCQPFFCHIYIASLFIFQTPRRSSNTTTTEQKQKKDLAMEKKNGADSCNSKMTITKEFDFAGETVKYVHVPSFFMSSSYEQCPTYFVYRQLKKIENPKYN